jgi:putative radical SAM enzyme (TIGR03279 family)
VEAGGAAQRAGLSAGDELLAADGEVLRDVIDWRWIADGVCVDVTLRSAADGGVRQVELTREPGETWGFAFTEPVFDGVRTCRNHCTFCFVAQLPAGVRASLRVRDDDYRLSFLHGNFITLTNLAHDDVDRIIEQHLSPLYVSIHASDPAVRESLIGARPEDHALEFFDELADAGIETHVQIVLVAGVNDGEVLDRTLDWLEARAGVVSVGMVPLGYTDHQTRFTSSFDAELAEQVIARVEPRREAHRRQTGRSWVHLADELYLKSGREIPVAEEYDGFPQYENGIGIVRSFLDDVAHRKVELADAMAALPIGRGVRLVAGEFAAPVLERVLRDLAPEGGPERAGVIAVPNTFFGGNVGVAGLLTAHDLVPAIAAGSAEHTYLVPDIVVNADGLLLDDVRAADLPSMTRRDVRLLSCDADGLLGVLRTLANDRA